MHSQMNETVCYCCCLHLSEGMAVSMAATSWQQCANDDERSALSLHDGFSRSLQSCSTEGESVGETEGVTGGDRSLICEED